MTEVFTAEELAALGLGRIIPPEQLPPDQLIAHMSGFALWMALKHAPRDPETKMLAAFTKRAIVAWVQPELADPLCEAIDGYLKAAPPPARPHLTVVEPDGA